MHPGSHRFAAVVLAVCTGFAGSACGDSTGPGRLPEYRLIATVTDDAGTPIAGAVVAIISAEATFTPCPDGGPGDCTDRAGGSAYTDATGRAEAVLRYSRTHCGDWFYRMVAAEGFETETGPFPRVNCDGPAQRTTVTVRLVRSPASQSSDP